MGLAERVAINATAQLIGQFLLAAGGLAAVAATTRYLSLKEYGALVTALIFVSLFVAVTDSGMTTTGGRELARAPERAEAIVSSTGLTVTAISFAAAAVAVAVSQIVYSGAGSADIRKAILILIPQLFLMGPRCAAQASLLARQKMYLVSTAGVVTRIVTLGLVVLVAQADLGFAAMAAAYAAFPILGAILTVLLAGVGLPRIRGWNGALAWRLLKAAIPLGGVLVVNFLYFRLDLFLLGFLATKDDVALYGVAYKLVEVLILIPSYVMFTLVPAIATAERFSDRLNSLVQNAFSAMQLVAVPLIALSFFSKSIIGFIAGSSYESAGVALQILVLSLAASYLQQVFSFSLVAQDRQLLALFVLVGVLAVNLGLNLVLIPLFKVNGAATAVLISELVSLVAMGFAFSRVGSVPSLYKPVRVSLAGAAMVGLVLGTRNTLGPLLNSPMATLAAGGALGLAAYVLVLKQLDAVPPVASAMISSLMRRRPRNA